MAAQRQSVCQMLLKGWVSLAGAAGIVPSVAVADGRVLVQAAAPVVYSGQMTRVKVYVCPSDPGVSDDPNAPYAFASAAFDVLANDVQWSFATDGKIVDGDVLDVEVSQEHKPELGIYADPSNPLRVWGGVIKPLSDGPAMVEIAIDPTSFFVYPSKDTSSSIQVQGQAGNDVILMNPLDVGEWLAAPGQGTTISVADDVIIDGRIITGENPATPIRIGMLLPAVQKVAESSTRVEFDQLPSSFTVNVQIPGAGDDVFQWDPGDGHDTVRPDAQRSRISSMTVTFDGLETGGYSTGANFVLSDGSVRSVGFDAFIGGIYVASGDFEEVGDNGIPGLVVYELPQTSEATTRRGTSVLSTANTYTGMTMVYDQPIVATIRDSKGMPQIVTLDRIELHGTGETGQWLTHLDRTYLGIHVFEAEGVKGMSITPSQGK